MCAVNHQRYQPRSFVGYDKPVHCISYVCRARVHDSYQLAPGCLSARTHPIATVTPTNTKTTNSPDPPIQRLASSP
jgi:hypothetical protein